jgi:PAS domain S-box-containing protein
MYNLSFFPSYFGLNPPGFINLIRVCIFLPVILLLFSLHTLAQQKYTDSLNEVTSDTIYIASEPDYPPFCIVNENGNADGFSVDIFTAAADAVRLSVVIKVGVWNYIKQELAEGKIDALPLVGRTPEREEHYDFTMSYLSLHGAVFVRKGTERIQSLADLKGKEIVVMKGDNAEEFVRRENISDKIFTTKTFEEAFKELAQGKYDAVINQRITGLKLLDEMGIESIVALDFQIPQFRQDFCFAVKKGNTMLLSRLNEGLSIIIANGTFEEIRIKWFGPADKSAIDLLRMAKTVLFILIPVILILVLLWIYFLRSQVKKRTQRLNEEIEEHKQTLNSLENQQKELKESEEQIRLLLNSTAEGIYAIDNHGKCTLVNKAALIALGYSSQQEMLGKNMHKLIHHTRADGTKCELESCEIYKTFKDGAEVHHENEVFWKAGGSSFLVEYYSHPIRKNGKVTGSVVTFWDITERKKAENELIRLKNHLGKEVDQRTAELADKLQKLDKSQRAMLYMVEDLNQITQALKQEKAKLKAANTELEAFTYSVSHDLRAPLRAINGFSKFLLEDYADKLDEEGQRFISTIRENAAKMDKLITDLLNLSRVSRASLNITDVDMKNLALAAFKDISDEEEQNTFEFLVSDLPEVSCDSSLMKQVWQNLIGNALKYSAKSETKKIEIGTKKNNTEHTFYIKDKGAGFNNKYKHKLFGVFQRLHHENEFEGTGVGLTIVQRIIQRHGGKVWAEGEISKGATFYFSLPFNNSVYI